MAVEVADRGVDVDRLDRVAAGEVDAVEVLRELHEVAEAFAVAGPPAAVEVHGVRRAGHIDEEHRVAADRHPALGVARRDVELPRRLLDLLHHKGAIHAHALRIHVDVAAGVLQDRRSASLFRNRMPISSRMRMAPSWMRSTPLRRAARSAGRGFPG